MWRRVKLDVQLDHPPARVYPYLADPVRWPEFAPACESRRRLGDGPPRVGTRWSAVDKVGPFRIRFTDELVRLEPERHVVWDSTDPWNSRVVYRLLPHPSGTRVQAEYAGDVAGWLRLVALLPTFVLARILLRDFHGLRRVLAAEDDDPKPAAGRG
jgi:uncharacterized protein YndB with AHSA1/START domain